MKQVYNKEEKQKTSVLATLVFVICIGFAELSYGQAAYLELIGSKIRLSIPAKWFPDDSKVLP
ncbi:hypothetical protein CHH80_13725 [Bacillus sp. 7504-2]|nr:hypothetical protein CHH80_13725 [Bacillus sp. 7504-2]